MSCFYRRSFLIILVCLVCLVDLVSLVYFVSMVSLVCWILGDILLDPWERCSICSLFVDRLER
jgi:hypothetical protein